MTYIPNILSLDSINKIGEFCAKNGIFFDFDVNEITFSFVKDRWKVKIFGDDLCKMSLEDLFQILEWEYRLL